MLYVDRHRSLNVAGIIHFGLGRRGSSVILLSGGTLCRRMLRWAQERSGPSIVPDGAWRRHPPGAQTSLLISEPGGLGPHVLISTHVVAYRAYPLRAGNRVCRRPRRRRPLGRDGSTKSNMTASAFWRDVTLPASGSLHAPETSSHIAFHSLRWQ
jgi:hypothetical protein